MRWKQSNWVDGGGCSSGRKGWSGGGTPGDGGVRGAGGILGGDSFLLCGTPSIPGLIGGTQSSLLQVANATNWARLASKMEPFQNWGA